MRPEAGYRIVLAILTNLWYLKNVKLTRWYGRRVGCAHSSICEREKQSV